MNPKAILAAALIAAAHSAALAQEPESFNAPSGNISCHYTPKGDLPRQTAGLHCVRFQPGPVRIFLGERGKAAIERGIRDACCDNSPVLAYGKSWSGTPFTCHSSEAGMRCERPDGRGFRVSRGKIDVY